MRSVETRVPLLATLSVTFALVLAVFAPGVLFVLGPVLFGVPHVASDVRYLVIRQGRTAPWMAMVALGCSALLALRLAEMSTARAFPFALAEVSIGWAWVALGAWMGAWSADSNSLQRPWLRASGITLLVAAAWIMSVAHPVLARGLIAYGHNLVAPIIWLVLLRGKKAWAALPLALVGAGACLLLSGTTVPLLHFDDPWIRALARDARARIPQGAPLHARHSSQNPVVTTGKAQPSG